MSEPVQVIVQPDHWLWLKLIFTSAFTVALYKLGVYDGRHPND